jgi:capsular polysaccharide biosynthesis protein
MEKVRQYWQNTKKIRAQFSLRVFMAGIILSAVFFLFFINISRTYTSSITIIVNAKSEITALQAEQIVGNLAELPKTLAFYDRLLKYNPNVRDIAEGKSQTERKEVWNSMLSVKKVGKNSSLLKISITTRQASDSYQLAQKTVRTLFDASATYYNIQSDLDLRIVDGPISYSNVAGWYGILPLSIILGFLIAFFIQRVLSRSKETFAFRRNIFGKNNLFNFKKETADFAQQDIKTLEDLYLAEQTQLPFKVQEKSPMPVSQPQENREPSASEFQEMKKLTKMFEPDKYPNFREVSKTSGQKAAAPENLPIADNSFFDQFPMDTETSFSGPSAEAKIHPEPTAEKLKERLNKLLRGEL